MRSLSACPSPLASRRPGPGRGYPPRGRAPGGRRTAGTGTGGTGTGGTGRSGSGASGASRLGHTVVGGVGCATVAAAWRTAPRAMSCLGWVSIAVRTPNSRCSRWLTSGIRELPPTRTTVARSEAGNPAERSARAVASRVSPQRRGDQPLELRAGQPHRGGDPGQLDGDRGVDVAGERLLGVDALRAAGGPAHGPWRRSSRSRPDSRSPSMPRTCWNTASSKSIPPRCSTPSGVPRIANPVSRLSRTHTSNVPPPRS